MSFRLLFALLGLLSALSSFCAWGQARPAASAPSAPPASVVSNYRLATGDVVSIRVFGEEDLSREKIRLTDAGTVFYPVLGEIQVLGKTVGEIEKQIADGLRGRYLVNPSVTVSIDSYRQYFVTGQVGAPGGFPYQPGLTVAKAVALAGGFKERASQSKMFVIRDADPKKNRERVELSTAIFPGDVLTIEESFF